MSEAAIEQLQAWGAETGIILGSGLGSLVRSVRVQENQIDYSVFPELPKPSVPGHAGSFVLTEIAGTRIILAQGRVHLYEGYSAIEVTSYVRFLAKIGIQRLLVTNAAGTTNRDFTPGSWMMIRDHINLTGTSPLRGHGNFVDMTEAYSSELRNTFREAAAANKIVLREGVYAAVRGPQYETPAEVEMLRRIGADAIGMSTVLEVIEARARGLEVAGFSCLTNWAAGMGEGR